MASAEPRAWLGGRVYTGRRWAEALLVEEGRVIAVGSDRSVRRAAATGTAREALGGRLVVPGLVDAHLHWLASVVDAAGVDLRGTTSIAELQRRLEAGLQRPDQAPLLGSGWDQERLRERRYPERADLDRVAPDRPVALYRICHHAAVVNSPALEALAISRETPDPPGGRIGRHPDGEPNGLLFDRAMRGLRTLSATAFQARSAQAGAFLRSLADRGLTSVGVMSAVPAEIELARHLHGIRALPLRLRFHLIAEQWDGRAPRRGPSGRAPRLVGLKVVLDGSLGARTAWLAEPYSDAPVERGMPLTSEAETTETARAGAAHGLGIAMHAIGDRAVAAAVRVAARAPREGPTPRIEHASVLSAGLVDRLARVRLLLAVQPSFVASDTWIGERLGPERARWTYPFAQLLARGVVVAGSSDAPIEPFDPWVGLSVAVRRCRLTPEQAIGMYTHGGSAAVYDPAAGSLEPGAAADLVVLEAHDLSGAIAAGGPVTETWCDGRRTAAPGAAKAAI